MPNISLIGAFAGDLGPFLFGLWFMTDGLRFAAGCAHVTSPVQSASPVTVAAIGFVNAGATHALKSTRKIDLIAAVPGKLRVMFNKFLLMREVEHRHHRWTLAHPPVRRWRQLQMQPARYRFATEAIAAAPFQNRDLNI